MLNLKINEKKESLNVVHYFLTFAFQSPRLKKGHLFLVLVLEGLIGLHATIQLHLLQN